MLTGWVTDFCVKILEPTLVSDPNFEFLSGLSGRKHTGAREFEFEFVHNGDEDGPGGHEQGGKMNEFWDPPGVVCGSWTVPEPGGLLEPGAGNPPKCGPRLS